MPEIDVKEARNRLAIARLWAAEKMPYMAHQVLSLVPIMRPGLGTFSVDQHMRMYWDPAFALEKTKDELAFIVLHEAMHPLLMHHLRCKGLCGEKPSQDQVQAWNWAGDACINESLVKSGLTCPEEGILPRDLSLPPNGTLEDYYHALMAKAQQKPPEPPPQQGQDQGDHDDQGEGEQPNNAEGKDNQKPPEGGEDQDDGEEDSSPGRGGDGPGDDREGQGDPGDSGPPAPGEADQDQPGDGGDAGGGPSGEPGEDQGGGSGADGAGQGDGSQAGEDGAAGAAPEGQAGSGQGNAIAPDGSYHGLQPNREQGQGGSGADGIAKPWEDPPDDRCMDTTDQELIRQVVAKAAEDYAKKGRGSVPGELLRMVDELLHPKVDPWKELLSKVRACVAHNSGFGDFTYKRRPRRTPAGVGILPAHVCPTPQVTVVADTSGSMDKSDLGLALGVIAQGLKTMHSPRGLRVLAGDTDVASAKTVFRHDQVELAGGGGTDMSMMIRRAMEEKPVPNVIVVVTDGYTGWPREPVAAKVLVALTRAACKQSVPKWADCVVVERE